MTWRAWVRPGDGLLYCRDLDALRDRVGAEAVVRHEELVALRGEVARLGDVLACLIGEVRGFG